MKKYSKLILGMCLAIGLVIAFIGCASAGVTKYKDFGVLDKKVPESEQAVLQFSNIMFKTINGQPVKWQSKYDMRQFTGTIKLPAGIYEFLFDYHFETLNETKIGNTLTTKQEIREIQDVKLTSEFKPGNRYFLTCSVRPDRTSSTFLINTTNMLSSAYGDHVPKAPKESTTPTVFEGEWVSPDKKMIYKFKGNIWEMTIEGNGVVSKQKGIFTITDKINMYFTQFWVNGKWFANPGVTVSMYTYSFKDGNLLLELEGISPQVVYTKR